MDLTKWMEPGIFRYECIPRKKSYFGEGPWVICAAQDFIKDIHDGICPSHKFLNDVKTYGLDNFTVELYVLDRSFFNDKKRKQALEDKKKSWPGEIY